MSSADSFISLSQTVWFYFLFLSYCTSWDSQDDVEVRGVMLTSGLQWDHSSEPWSLSPLPWPVVTAS